MLHGLIQLVVHVECFIVGQLTLLVVLFTDSCIVKILQSCAMSVYFGLLDFWLNLYQVLK